MYHKLWHASYRLDKAFQSSIQRVKLYFSSPRCPPLLHHSISSFTFDGLGTLRHSKSSFTFHGLGVLCYFLDHLSRFGMKTDGTGLWSLSFVHYFNLFSLCSGAWYLGICREDRLKAPKEHSQSFLSISRVTFSGTVSRHNPCILRLREKMCYRIQHKGTRTQQTSASTT